MAVLEKLATLATQFGLLPVVLCAIIWLAFKFIERWVVKQGDQITKMLSVLEVQSKSSSDMAAAIAQIAEQLRKITVSLAILATRIKADYVEDAELSPVVKRGVTGRDPKKGGTG